MEVSTSKNDVFFQDTTKTTLLKNFGNHTLAYSAFLLDHYKSKNSQGYIPFHHSLNGSGDNLIIIVGDPIAQKQDYANIITEFIKKYTNNRIPFIGAQVGLECAIEFNEHGYCATNMGFELLINIPTFNTKGKHRSRLRRLLNTAINSGVYIKEIVIDESNRTELEYVSDIWLKSRVNKEDLRLLLSKPSFEHDPDTRVFCAYIKEHIVGFIIFDPMYEGENISGYYANIIRYLPYAPNGTSDLILNTALKRFKEEGKCQLSLGMSPLAELNHTRFEDLITRYLFQITYQFANQIYPFKNTYHHKRLYFDPNNIQSVKRPVYFISSGQRRIRDLLDLCQCIGLIPQNTYKNMLYYWINHIFQGIISKYTHKAQSSKIILDNTRY
jgi:lysylphosphatidylglycerol synthetase-like protein (DUF2156 family)